MEAQTRMLILQDRARDLELGAVRSGAVWRGAVWHGAVRSGAVWRGAEWCGAEDGHFPK